MVVDTGVTVALGDAGGTAVAVEVGDGATTGFVGEAKARVGEGLASCAEAGTNRTTTD